MTLEFRAPYQIDPNYNPEQEGLDRISQALSGLSSSSDKFAQETRQNRMQDLQMQLLKQEEARKQAEDQRKMMETRGEWGTPAPSSSVNPISGPMTQGQGIRTALDPSSPASAPSMIDRFRSWQQQRRGGPVQPEIGMPSPSVGYNEVLPSVPGYSPEQIRAVGGVGRTSLGSKQTEQLTKLFPKEKPETPDTLEKVLAQRVLSGELSLEDAMKMKSSSNPQSMPSFQIIGSQDGTTVAVNPKTLETRPVKLPGQGPLMSTTQSEGQANATLFANRMDEANRQIEDLSSRFDLTSASSGAQGILPNVSKSKEIQMFEQSKRNFINAVLRRESGAVISPTEFSEGNKQYFPVFGDSPEVLKQKAMNRKTALEGLRNAAGMRQVNGMGGGMIRVRNKQTGQTGQIPSANFNPSKYDQL